LSVWGHMPHRCIECKNILESGEVDLDTGCPVCGGKKFQFIRAKKEPRVPGEKDLRTLTVAEYVSHTVSSGIDREKVREHKEAQKTAAAEVKPEAKDKKRSAERIESVRILEKGSYDINLPVLLSRKELVMSKEDGVYVVDLPSALKTSKKKKNKKKR